MKTLAAWLAIALTLPAGAVERIRLRADQVEVAGVVVTGLDATLRIRSNTRSELLVQARRLELPADLATQTGSITALTLRCDNPQVQEPLFACPAFDLAAISALWGHQRLTGEAHLRTDTGALQVQGEGPPIAGVPLRFAVDYDATALVASAALDELSLAELAAAATTFLPLPEGLTIEGKGDARATFTQRDGRMLAGIGFAFAEAGYNNAEYTWIGERLAMAFSAEVDFAATPWALTINAQGHTGQALAGPVLLDFDQNPWTLFASARIEDDQLVVDSLESRQQDLATVRAEAVVSFEPVALTTASIVIDDVRFPAAYASYLQVLLATTPFNQLTTSGRAEARMEIRDNLPVQMDWLLHDLAFSDPSRDLEVAGFSAAVHWRDDGIGGQPSWLAWETARGWGITGSDSRLDFALGGRDFRLLQPARLPIFDGALQIHSLAVEHIGSEQLAGAFDATIEPISIGPLAMAFGLPEFPGQISGRIPGLTYSEGLLSLAGNIEADVFDGHVVASDLRVRDPLGPWPRLYANIVARGLDLGLITRTFEIGGITGRLDVDLVGLETFNWSPVAFDLRLATPPGDRSRRRISQRAVQSLSDFGGGGGGVAAALQSGVLKFFDDFGYRRIGLSCRLRNDVCQMDGVGRADNDGFYIVRGSGLPHLDIIGINRRVDWPLLMRQVREALANPGGIDVR